MCLFYGKNHPKFTGFCVAPQLMGVLVWLTIVTGVFFLHPFHTQKSFIDIFLSEPELKKLFEAELKLSF